MVRRLCHHLRFQAEAGCCGQNVGGCRFGRVLRRVAKPELLHGHQMVGQLSWECAGKP